MNQQAPSMVTPALVAGAVFGVLSGIPLVGALNCLCCALVIGGGFFAAFLYSKQAREANVPFAPGNGAVVGLLSGVFHAIVATIVSAVFNLLFGLGDWTQAIDQMEEYGQMDPETIDQISRFMDSTGPVVMILIGFLVWLLLGAIFATIGGLIGGAVFKNEPPIGGAGTMPPPPPTEPPPPGTPPTRPPTV